MATTGFWPVKDRLKEVIDYAKNPDKTIDKKYKLCILSDGQEVWKPHLRPLPPTGNLRCRMFGTREKHLERRRVLRWEQKRILAETKRRAVTSEDFESGYWYCPRPVRQLQSLWNPFKGYGLWNLPWWKLRPLFRERDRLAEGSPLRNCSLFSFCFAKLIWRLTANSENMQIAKV